MKLFIAFLAFVFLFGGVVECQQPYVTAIAGGQDHYLALRSDGTVFAWGSNSFGQLGAVGGNSNVPILSPLPGGVIAVSAGGNYSLVVKSDGTVWRLGSNPIQIIGLSQVVAVAGGEDQSIALKSDGTVWGFSGGSVPILLVGTTGVVAIASGAHFHLALKSDGTVWMGTSSFQQVPGLAGIIAITAGSNHFLALKSDGTVWQSNLQVAGLIGVVGIAGGNSHSLALLSDGTVRSWGANGSGELGNGTMGGGSSTPITANISGVVLLAKSFDSSSLALKADGTLWAWGNNVNGQLGIGTFGGSHPAPSQVLLSSSPPPPPPPPLCSAGNVNSANGPPVDVLLINGSPGNASRIVNVALNAPITITLASPPAGPSSSFAIVWGWIGYPTTPTTLNAFGQNLGCTVNPTSFLSTLAPQPLVTVPVYTPAVDGCPAGFPTPGVATLQAMIIDFGANNASSFSITNAVILNVQ